MKSNLFRLGLSLLLFITASFFCSAQSVDQIKFKNPTHKFKKVAEGHQLVFTYNFSYSGTDQLTILEPKVDCSCTEVILPKEKIKAGKIYSIIIKFDTHHKIGWQEREVLIQFTTDIKKKSTIDKKITFKGMIKASKPTKEAYKANKRK
jgi:hypothetical protein